MPNEKPCALVIDDDFSVRQSLKLLLSDYYHVLTAAGSFEGQLYLTVHSVDIVLLDIRLKESNGLELLAYIKHMHPYTEVIMITAYASLETTQKAIRLGAFDYLIKPFDKNELTGAMNSAMSQRNDKLSIKNELDKLRESTLYLEQLIRNVKSTLVSSSENIMTAMLINIDSRDGYTWSHVRRVTDLSSMIARTINMSDEQIQWLKCSSLLHDIGKINIDGDILKKDRELTEDEYTIIKKHPEEGAEILRPIPFLERAIPSIKHHHERYDGTGYPGALKGEEIPFGARILAVADAIDSMTNSPLKQNPYAKEKVEKELQLHSGSQFDPEVVDVVRNKDLLSFF